MELHHIDGGQGFDWGRAADAYARYRDIYPPILFEKLHALGVGAAGSRWLDLGTGTGVAPRAMAHYGADIVGADIAPEQIEQARRLSADMPNVRYLAAPAEETGLPDASFDAVTALMCFWYFDPPRITAEIRRLLKPGGIFVKVYMSWLKEDPIADASKTLIKRMNPQWTAASSAVADLKTHYFDEPVMDAFTAEIPFTRESWHGRILANRGVMGSMDAETLAAFEAAHLDWAQTLPERFVIPHRVFITGYRL